VTTVIDRSELTEYVGCWVDEVVIDDGILGVGVIWADEEKLEVTVGECNELNELDLVR
jgi:hypothetical protein